MSGEGVECVSVEGMERVSGERVGGGMECVREWSVCGECESGEVV